MEHVEMHINFIEVNITYFMCTFTFFQKLNILHENVLDIARNSKTPLLYYQQILAVREIDDFSI